jgi:hypothetical protein
MILPLRVLGSSGVNVRYLGVVNLPSWTPTCVCSSSASAGEPVSVLLRLTKQPIVWPVTSSSLPTTAASVDPTLMRADDISMRKRST